MSAETYLTLARGWRVANRTKEKPMTNTPKSPTRDPSTTTTKEDEIESMEQEQLGRVTGGANWLHLEVPDTYIYVGPVHK
jgi:hypothetical protein